MKPAVVQQQLVKVLLGYVDAALVPQQGPASELQVVVASKNDCLPSAHETSLEVQGTVVSACQLRLVSKVPPTRLTRPAAPRCAVGYLTCCIAATAGGGLCDAGGLLNASHQCDMVSETQVTAFQGVEPTRAEWQAGACSTCRGKQGITWSLESGCIPWPHGDLSGAASMVLDCCLAGGKSQDVINMSAVSTRLHLVC